MVMVKLFLNSITNLIFRTQTNNEINGLVGLDMVSKGSMV